VINRKQNIPQGWRIDLLENLANRGSGHTPDKNESGYWNGGIKWVSLADSWRLDNLFISETDKEISILGLQNSSAVLHPPDTVILSRDAGVGKSAILKSEMAVSQHFIAWRCQPKNKLFNLFFYYWLQLRKEEFERVAVGSTIKTIGLPYFKKLKIVYPPLAEQKKIAEIINCWDSAIALTEKLLTAKRRLKQGLTQNLITGKLQFQEFAKSKSKQKIQIGRIPANWRIAKIGEIAREVSERLAPENTTVLSCTKYDGLVPSLEYFGRQVFGENLDNYKIVKRDQFAYATNHIEEGSIGLLRDFEAGLVSPMYTVFRVDADIVEPEFLYSVLKTETYRRVFESLTSASVNRRGSLRWNGFSKIVVPLPTILEQKKIVSVLKMADSEIKLLSTKLELLKTQKQGLMQQLLTGKIRIQTP
jgi:type I restriction enzyme, S subunit